MKATRENPILYIVIPCYNEQEVLPITSKLFLKKITDLVAAGKISDDSRVLFVNDGSKDKTWSIICDLAKSDKHYIGISQSRNRGHQNAVLAGLMEAKDKCDITISIDCDGQDDINAMDAMVDAYVNDGCEVVYGVRSKRDTDTFFKRFTAESFYKLLNAMGAEVVYNHADYRLMSARVLHEFANFKEVNCAAWCRWWALNPPALLTSATSALRVKATIPCPKCCPLRLTASPAFPSSPSGSLPGLALLWRSSALSA